MIPSIFLQIEAFPLTPNGKIDRKALVFPSITEPFLRKDSSIESMLTKILEETLCCECIDIHDNFFDKGGDSIRMTRVQTRISEDLNTTISITDLFQYPTIYLLSQYLAKKNTLSSIAGLDKNRTAKRNAVFHSFRKNSSHELV